MLQLFSYNNALIFVYLLYLFFFLFHRIHFFTSCFIYEFFFDVFLVPLYLYHFQPFYLVDYLCFFICHYPAISVVIVFQSSLAIIIVYVYVVIEIVTISLVIHNFFILCAFPSYLMSASLLKSS